VKQNLKQAGRRQTFVPGEGHEGSLPHKEKTGKEGRDVGLTCFSLIAIRGKKSDRGGGKKLKGSYQGWSTS